MSNITLDFVAHEPDNSIWSLILVERGAWEQEEIGENLRKLQKRLYDSIDIAVDGIFAKEYPDSIGKDFVIRVDGYELPGNDVSEFFKSFAESVLEIPDYKSALRDSTYVHSINFDINLEESSNGIKPARAIRATRARKLPQCINVIYLKR